VDDMKIVLFKYKWNSWHCISKKARANMCCVAVPF